MGIARLGATFLAISVTLTACSSTPSLPDDIGQLHYENDGVRITVPALWAGVDKDGNPVGGVEPAQIFVSTASLTPEYSVNLADIAAEGAGESWQAATGMASAFATVFASADPAAVDLNFTVTGPIDGPSAGGILTVGLIAAFQGQSLTPRTTMTGTITADGSIGPVGGVLTKIESAAREGFTTVVVPSALSSRDWSDGNQFTELANSLGVTLVPVDTIGQAYAAMTGMPLGEPDLTPGPALSQKTQLATSRETQENLDLLAQILESSQSEIPSDLTTWADQQLAEARTDVASGNNARAYGNSVFTLTQLVRAQARSEVAASIEAKGSQVTRDLLVDRAEDVLDRARLTLSDASLTPVRGLSQCFALPTALGWSAFAEVTIEGVLDSLSVTSEESTLQEMAASIAESELGITVFLPQALGVVQSLNEGAGEDCNQIAQHLSGYSRFLVQAADSTTTYLTKVLGTTLDDVELKQDYTSGALAADQMAEGVTPEIDTYPSEAQQLTLALTYFWLTSYAVSAQQAYAVMPGQLPGEYAAMRKDAMDISVEETWWFTKYRAELLTEQGLDTGAPIWSARWALEQSLAQREGPYSTDADWLALGELWYDAIQVTTMLSYLEPAAIPTVKP